MTAGNPVETFRTHANYIRAFSRLSAGGEHDRREALDAVVLRFNRSCDAVNGQADDRAGILRSLQHAWATELLLDVTAASIPDDEFARLANNWVVVQAYYAAYHATQALSQAKGWPRPEAHSPTQKTFGTLWSGLAIPLVPWGLAANDNGWTGVPAEVQIERNIHPWVRCDANTCWSIAAKALRTTRDDAVTEAYGKRREEKGRDRRRAWRDAENVRIAEGRRPRREPRVTRPALDTVEKRRVAARVRAHTLIDYLYRLRIKTNYQDSAMFTDGPEDAESSRDVRDCLRWLASSTIFINELAIGRIVGGAWLRKRGGDVVG
jgi:hypothetical protein